MGGRENRNGREEGREKVTKAREREGMDVDVQAGDLTEWGWSSVLAGSERMQ